MRRRWPFGSGAGRQATRERTAGYPASSNRASSLHLVWEAPGALREVSAVLTVPADPAVDDLYFWALQVSFADGAGAHLGLQWLGAGRRGVNWGGYAASGGELAGTSSPLPDHFANPNTRGFDWQPGRPYRLTIRRASDGWAGIVEDADAGPPVEIRRLAAGGSTLHAPMVWSEVFARCDAPAHEVHWSALRLIDAEGSERAPTAVRVGYQRVGDGGCTNTTSLVDGGALVQRTASPRVTPDGAVLAVP